MRLAAQAKRGFYPAPTEAVELMLSHLKLAAEKPGNSLYADDDFNIIDPCAGEGVAVQQISNGLGIKEEKVYCIELDPGRANAVRERMPQAKVLGPCSFHSAWVSPVSFGLVYLNPPFDDQFGGGDREEVKFLERAYELMKPGGILVFVLPINQFLGTSRMAMAMDSRFSDIEMYKFPESVQKYREVVVFAKRRSAMLAGYDLYTHGVMHKRSWNYVYNSQMVMTAIPPLGSPNYVSWNGVQPSYERRPTVDVWEVPFARCPRSFAKLDYTPEEFVEALVGSPLNDLLDVTPTPDSIEAPLALSKGHVSINLVAGTMDGLVEADPPHVVRGYARKVERLAAVSSTVNEKSGALTTKTVYEEDMIPGIRAVEQDGKIIDFTLQTSDDDQGEEDLFDDED
jgi:predicted RNA methylase